MRFTHILVGILCILCFVSTGHIAEGSGPGQLTIGVPHLLTELPITWRPEAHSSLRFHIKVTKPAHYSGGKLIATLSDVTDYRGSCGNQWSPYNDLELRQSPFHNSGWRVETELKSLSISITDNTGSSEAPEWMYLRVYCEDYAAYGKLTLTTAESSVTEAYPVEIIIPRDINGNKIADCWRDDETTADPNNSNPSKNYVANWDQESGPDAPNTQRGDNLTVLDEYRGLFVQGAWTDTEPEGWDVFIRSEAGLGRAEDLPNMTCHLMGLNEVSHVTGEVLTYQASITVILGDVILGDVYAIRLRNDPTQYDRQHPQEALGHIGLGPPSSGTRGNIFTDRIRACAIINGNGQTAATLTDAVVAHEIGHGVHLRHCPDHIDLNCYMWQFGDRESHNVTAYGNHHKVDYDLKSPTFAPQQPLAVPENHVRTYDPNTGTWTLSASVDDVVQLPGITVTPSNNNVPGGNSHLTPYGCHNIAENDWCSDDGTCTTRSDASSDGPCEHRWCLCANYNGNGGTSDDTSNNGGDTSEDTSSNTIISTNTGLSSNGCDYNAEHDYCSDTGSCTTTSDPYSNGSCGHRHCLCANHNDSIISTNTGPSENGCDYNAERDYCTDAGSCTTTSDPASNGPCGHRYCLCAQ